MGNKPSIITKEELNNLEKNNQIIIFIGKKVFNITNFLEQHPGGKQCFYKYHLKDTKESFDFHSYNAQKIWKQYFIGVLD